MISPFSIYMFNSIFIPYFVYYATEFVVFERKSDKLKSKLVIYYIFFLMNAVFLPISKLDSIKSMFFMFEKKTYVF